MKIIRQSILVILILNFVVGCGINNIPTDDEQVKAAWSEVENQYQRRADLIPNLVTIVKQASEHEQSTLLEIVKARAELNSISTKDLFDNKERMAKYQKLQHTIGTNMNIILQQVERYPVLQANQNFLQLSSQLEGTENRIAIARREYIVSLQKYNTELKTYPGKLYQSIFYRDYVPRSDSVYFSAESKNPPVIKFD